MISPTTPVSGARLAQHNQPCALVVRDHELPYADPSQALLLKPYGTADQPDSVLVTEEDLDHFLSSYKPSRPLLLDQLRVWAATKVLLWIGVDPADATGSGCTTR